MRRSELEVTDINGIEEILLQCKTCHIAMVDNGSPYLVPMSYGYKIFDDKKLELYFHSASEGRKIDVLKRNNKVCFELSCEGSPVNSETPCSSGYYFSSVIGFGEVEFLDDIEGKSNALSFMYKHQTGKNAVFSAEQVKNVSVFRIVSTDFTGKKKQRPHK